MWKPGSTRRDTPVFPARASGVAAADGSAEVTAPLIYLPPGV
jgi:hypothetical protein